jgi:protein phosphatase
MTDMTDDTSPGRLQVIGAMLTHVGRVRSINEDTVAFVVPMEGSPDKEMGSLALVADGMGGHAAGEVASALAADVVRRVVYSADGSVPHALRTAFEAANRAIRDYSAANPETRGMGTTCTAIVIRRNILWLAHVGDSRAYLLRDGVFEQLSDDQTLHAQLIRDGVMSPEEAEKDPRRNFILQALGARDEITPTMPEQGWQLRAGDIVLLCSDGLYALVKDEEIAKIARESNPQEACQELIEKALSAGGLDNISVGVFQIVDAAPARKLEQASTKRIPIIQVDANPGVSPNAI